MASNVVNDSLKQALISKATLDSEQPSLRLTVIDVDRVASAGEAAIQVNRETIPDSLKSASTCYWALSTSFYVAMSTMALALPIIAQVRNNYTNPLESPVDFNIIVFSPLTVGSHLFLQGYSFFHRHKRMGSREESKVYTANLIFGVIAFAFNFIAVPSNPVSTYTPIGKYLSPFTMTMACARIVGACCVPQLAVIKRIASINKSLGSLSHSVFSICRR